MAGCRVLFEASLFGPIALVAFLVAFGLLLMGGWARAWRRGSRIAPGLAVAIWAGAFVLAWTRLSFALAVQEEAVVEARGPLAILPSAERARWPEQGGLSWVCVGGACARAPIGAPYVLDRRDIRFGALAGFNALSRAQGDFRMAMAADRVVKLEACSPDRIL